MLLSSGVVWRHREWEDFRAECPGGDPALQRLVWERLDDALDWLVSLGAEPVWQDTENPLTTGKRFDPRALTALLARDVQLETPLPARASSRRSCSRRADSASGLRPSAGCSCARIRGATAPGSTTRPRAARGTTDGMDEFYGRAMPAPPARIREEDFVPLSQLYGRWARVYTDDGRDITPATVSWSENDLAQQIGAAGLVRARRRGARACERPRRGGARRGRHRGRAARAPVRDAGGVARRGARRGGGHAHDRRHPGRHERATPSTASTSPASMRAASRPAATRAASRRRSSSASSRRKRSRPDPGECPRSRLRHRVSGAVAAQPCGRRRFP